MAILKNTVINDTGHLTIPSGSNSQRPASPTIGMTRFNTDWKSWETWNGSQWEGSPATLSTYSGASEDFNAGDYKYLVFNGSGSFTVSTGGEIEIFVIGGGGGGGGTQNNSIYGGDAGQTISGKFGISAGTYSISIGAGGIASDGWNSNAATAGGNTTISSFLTAVGGQPANNNFCCPGNSQYDTVKLGRGRGTNGTQAGGQSSAGSILTFIPTSNSSSSQRNYGLGFGHYFLDNTPPNQSANTGNGGWGVWSNASRKGGNGGSGICIIKIQLQFI